MKSQSKNIIKNTYSNFIKNYKTSIFIEIFYKLISLFVFIPINYMLLTISVSNTGKHALTNKDLISLISTVPGILSIALLVAISAIMIFTEIAILTYVSKKSHKNEDTKALEGSISCIKLLPKSFNIYTLIIVFISGVIGPVIGIGLYSSVLKKIAIPSFIKIELYKTLPGKIIFYIVLGVLAIILLRWVMAIPAMIIENTTPKEAFKNSIKIYKNIKYKIIYYLLLWIVVTILIKALLLASYILCSTLIILISSIIPIVGETLTLICMLLFLIGYVLISIVSLPLFISFIVELYYEYKCYSIEERVFDETKEYLFINKNRNSLTIAMIALFCITIGSISIKAVFDTSIYKDIAITAHRGSSKKAPENSISSIKEAIKEGADYAEIDVMTTKDNKVVLFHDSTLKRIDNTNRKIKDMGLEEVKKVDNGSYFNLAFKDEKIPTLEDVFKLSKGKIKLNIELKPTSKNDLLSKEVSKLIKHYNMEDDVIVSCIDYKVIEQFKNDNSQIICGAILTFGLGRFDFLNVDFVSVEYGLLNRNLVYSMNSLGKEVHVWTLNERKDISKAVRYNVDNIITDSVDTVQETIHELQGDQINNLEIFYNSIISIVRYVNI